MSCAQHVLAFVYLLKFFRSLGAAGNYLPLLAIVVILIFWHITRRRTNGMWNHRCMWG